MSEKWHKVLLIVAAVVALISLTVVGIALWSKLKDRTEGDQLVTAPTLSPEEQKENSIFVKTIHDFEGYQVVSLDGSESGNFVVYATGVQEMESGETTNVLESVIVEERLYTFLYPSDELKALQSGDVFFIAPSRYNLEGLTAKVKEIAVEDNRVVITGDEVFVEDLFVYADINMDIPLREVLYDESQLDEMTQIEVVNASTEPSVVFASARDGDFSGEINVPTINFSKGLSISFGASTGDRIDGASFSGTGSLSGTLTTSLSGIHVKFRFSKEDQYFCFDTSCNLTDTLGVSVEFEGAFNSDNYSDKKAPWKKFPTVRIPLVGPVCARLDPYVGVSLSGTISGKFESSRTNAFGVSYYPETGATGYATKSSDLDGKAEIEGCLEVTGGIRLGVEIPFVTSAYLKGVGGVNLVGTPAFLGDHGDKIHDCTKCIDGDVNLLVRVSAHVELNLFKDFLDWDLSKQWPVLDESVKVGDFFYSYRKHAGYDFGWDECPHWRWQTAVYVKRDDEFLDGARVIATYPDGRTDQGTTNEDGFVVFYLPDGNTALKCDYNGLEGAGIAAVNGAPTTATIKISSDQRLFVQIPNNCEQKYPWIYSVLAGYYPDAIYYYGDNQSLQPIGGDVILCVEVETEWNDTTGEEVVFVLASVSTVRSVETENGTTYATEFVYSAGKELEYTIEYRSAYQTSGYSMQAMSYYQPAEVWEEEIVLPTEPVVPDGYVPPEPETPPFTEPPTQAPAGPGLEMPTQPMKGYIKEANYIIYEDWNLKTYGATPEQDVIVYSNQSTSSVGAPGKDMTTEDFFNSYDDLHHAQLAGILVRTFPYIDLWRNGTWNDGVDNMVP